MSPFRRAGKHGYYAKVIARSGRTRIVSLGTRDLATAKKAWRLYETLRDQWRWDVIELLVSGAMRLPELYQAGPLGGAESEAFIARAQAEAAVVDLRPHLEGFVSERVRDQRGVVVAPEYARMLRTLYPLGEAFTGATFTTEEIARRIDARDVRPATKARHRAAVTQFAAYLLQHRVLATDPTVGLKSWNRGQPRTMYHEAADARRAIEGTPGVALRGALAYALACAAEWGAVERVRARDLLLDAEPPQCLVPGTKNPRRWRWVPIVDELRWTIPLIKAAIADRLPDAPAFALMHRVRARLAWQRQCRAMHLPVTTLHDLRHTHAVALLRWGYDEQIVAAHLGHKSTALTREVYGRWIPARSDYATKRPRPTPEVTSQVTSLTPRLTSGGSSV